MRASELMVKCSTLSARILKLAHAKMAKIKESKNSRSRPLY